jgi:purine-cytosine permease-like protein
MDSSNFQPPVRRSLSNEELEARVNQAMSSHSGVEAVMELLVAQEALRAQEDQEEQLWVENMRQNGSPEAQAALNTFLGVSTPTPVQEPVAEVETPFVEPVQVVEPVQIAEPVVEVPVVEAPVQPEPPKAPPVFTWLNPAPPTPVAKPDLIEEPVVEITEEEIIEAIQPEEPSAFSWFTKTEEPEAVLVEETVVEIVEVLPEETVVEIVEVLPEEDLVPAGSESESEFEMLLAAAAAEEELTALEESEKKTVVSLAATESNVLIPSDEHRNRGPLSQLWVWIGASATIVPVLLVWLLISLGLNATAVTSALVGGYFVSGLLIAVAAIAGKRSGLSTATISRSVFGVWGNSIPLSLSFLVRVVVAAILVSAFTFFLNQLGVMTEEFATVLLDVAGIEFTLGFVFQIVFVLAAASVALFRGTLGRTTQVLISVIAFALFIESFAAVASQSVSFTAVGSTELVSLTGLAGFALVVMVNLTLWFALAPNISKAIPMSVRGIKVFSAVLVANFALPVLVGIGAVLWLGSLSAATTTAALSPLQALEVLPTWAQGTVTAGAALAIFFATVLTLRTAALDYVSLFRTKSRVTGLVLTVVAVALALSLFAQQPESQQVTYLSNLFILVAAISAGWVGIFAADVAIRRQAYHELSLSRSYGLYKKFNILALITWLITLAVSVALIPVNLFGFDFMGFALPMIGIEANVGSAAIGFLATVTIGMLLTFAIRIPQIRKQEREVLELEARRDQLNDIFVGTE